MRWHSLRLLLKATREVAEPWMPGGVTGRGKRQWKKSQAVVLMWLIHFPLGFVNVPTQKKTTALGIYFNIFLTQSFFSSFLLLTWHLISKYGKADVSFLFLPHLIVTDDMVTFVHIYAKPNDQKHYYFCAYYATNLEFGINHTLGGRHYLKDLLS